MNSFSQKWAYLLRSLSAWRQERCCPFCGGHSFNPIDSKYFGVTRLLQCRSCALQHRHPKDKEEFLQLFYQEDYKVDVDWMTTLPDADTLQKLKATRFPELRDYGSLIQAALKRDTGISVLDYGCSWGYNVYKLCAQGLDAQGYELSKPRAEFGRQNLGIRLTHEESQLPGNLDVFFSAHVIEHLPDLQRFIALAQSKLKTQGLFMAFCPNGSAAYKNRDFATFHVTWGSLHPLYLDIEFARHLFRNNPYLLMTSDWPYPLEALSSWDGQSQQVIGPTDGYELLLLAKPNVLLASSASTPSFQ